MKESLIESCLHDWAEKMVQIMPCGRSSLASKESWPLGKISISMPSSFRHLQLFSKLLARTAMLSVVCKVDIVEVDDRATPLLLPLSGTVLHRNEGVAKPVLQSESELARSKHVRNLTISSLDSRCIVANSNMFVYMFDHGPWIACALS